MDLQGKLIGKIWALSAIDDKSKARKEAEKLRKALKTFDEIKELAVFYIRNLEDKKEGRKLLKEAEKKITCFDDESRMADAVLNALNDFKWGRKLFDKAVLKFKSESSEYFCVMAEVISHPQGLNDRKQARELLKIALGLADTDKQKMSVADSAEDCLEEKWENGKITKLVY